MRHAFLTALSFLSLSTLAAGASAAEWYRPVTGAPVLSAHAFDAPAVADAFLAAEASHLDLTAVSLRRARMLTSGRHHTVRYEQRHQGLPVIGAQAAVRVGADGAVHAATFNLERHLSVSTVPAVEADAAITAVAGVTGAAPELMRASLAVWPDGQGGILTWQVEVPSSRGGERALVDAHTGLIFQLQPVGFSALGRVYPISSVVTPTTQDLELTGLDVASPQHLNGHGGNLVVTNYVSGGTQMTPLEVEQSLVPNSGEDFLYDPPAMANDPADAFAQVMVYYHLTRMRDFYATTLGLDMSAPSWGLVAVANYQEGGESTDNAFFSQQGISGDFVAPNLVGIGQGTVDFALDSDVFNHEFTHYVTHNAVNYNAGQLHSTEYGVSPFSGGIDEGISDYFACSVNDDPTLGEASLGVLSAARDLTDTSKSCPDDISGQVHADGEIVGSIGWTLRESMGAAKADQLMWDAVTLLTFGATLGDFGRALQQAGDDLLADGTITQEDRDLIDARVEARGLHECDAEVPLRKDEPRVANLVGLDLLALFFGGTCEQVKGFGAELSSYFHFKVTPDAGDEQVRVTVDLTPQDGGDLGWKLYARANDHVEFQPGMFLPTVNAFDYESDTFTETEGEFVIDSTSNPPFDPNATYSFVLVHQNCPISQASISTDAGEAPMGTGGGGMGGGGGVGGGAGGADLPLPAQPIAVDDGCGCRVTGVPSSRWPGWLATLGLGLVVLRRRRS